MLKLTARFTQLNRRSWGLATVGALLVIVVVAGALLAGRPALAARASAGVANPRPYATKDERDAPHQEYYGEDGKIVTRARAMIGRKVEWDSGRKKLATNQDLVCIDVSIISAQQSGLDIRGKMEDDYYKNQEKIREYDHGDILLQAKRFLGGYNNQPGAEQFYRRVQNVVTYQINQGLYYSADDPSFIPQAGMLIVYDHINRETGAVEPEAHSGVITAVQDGKVTRVILATNTTNPPSVQEYTPTELKLMTKRGFSVNGYGAWPDP